MLGLPDDYITYEQIETLVNAIRPRSPLGCPWCPTA